MFITTSRKPSAKTRTFCHSLSRALGAEYANRGKMSFRDILIKAAPFKCIALISQMKGNPSRIEFYNGKGEIQLTLYIRDAILNLKGRIDPAKLTLRSEVDDLTGPLLKILELEKDNKDHNLLWIKKGHEDGEAVLEFYGKQGSMVNPKIYVRRFQ